MGLMYKEITATVSADLDVCLRVLACQTRREIVARGGENNCELYVWRWSINELSHKPFKNDLAATHIGIYSSELSPNFRPTEVE